MVEPSDLRRAANGASPSPPLPPRPAAPYYQRRYQQVQSAPSKDSSASQQKPQQKSDLQKIREEKREDEEEIELPENLEFLAPFVKTVKRNLALIVFAFAFLLAIYFYLFVFPRPGSLLVSVQELDFGKAVIAAQVTLYDDSGAVVAEGSTDETGSVSFEGVPGGKPLTARVSAGSRYKPFSQAVSIASGGSVSLSLDLEPNWSITSTPEKVSAQIPEGCVDSVSVSLTSSEKDNSDIISGLSFVVDPKLAPYLKAPEPQDLYPGTPTAFVFRASGLKKGDAPVSGAVRIRGTNSKISFTLSGAERASASISPNSISKKVGLRAVIKEQVTIVNGGKSPISSFNFSVSGEIEPWTKINPFGGDTSPIAPGDTRIVDVVFTAPSQAGEYIGQLIFTTNCVKQPIPVRITTEYKSD